MRARDEREQHRHDRAHEHVEHRGRPTRCRPGGGVGCSVVLPVTVSVLTLPPGRAPPTITRRPARPRPVRSPRCRRAGRARCTAIRSEISSSSSRSVEMTSAAPPSSRASGSGPGRSRSSARRARRSACGRPLPWGRSSARARAGPSGCCRPRASPARVVDEGRAHVELADELGGAAIDDGPWICPRRQYGRSPMRLRNEVQPDGQRADDAFAEAVVGDVAQAELLPRRRRSGASPARRTGRTSPCGRLPLAGDHLGERALAVPVDPRDAEDLALASARATPPRCPAPRRRRERVTPPARAPSRRPPTAPPCASTWPAPPAARRRPRPRAPPRRT